jgi:hypothetical protein
VVGDNEDDSELRTMTRISSFSERPGHHRPRRLADWLNPTGARKVHSLETCVSDSFPQPASMTCLCESRMRETCTSGLSGGRGPALRRAPSDPTPEKLPNNAGLLPVAEVVEGRRPTKGNTESTAASRTLSRLDASIARFRVREAAGFYANHPK